MKGMKLKKHILTLNEKAFSNNQCFEGCGECQTSCQSACKTSCTVANQICENKKNKIEDINKNYKIWLNSK